MISEWLCVQLTEDWGDALFGALKKAGGHAYSNMAVGYNNVDVDAATRHGIAVGNTPVWTSCSQMYILLRTCGVFKAHRSVSNGISLFALTSVFILFSVDFYFLFYIMLYIFTENSFLNVQTYNLM